MRNIISCTFATLAVICLVGGLVILKKLRGAINVEKLERILSMLDHSLNTKKKHHIAGGILMSVSMIFGGLAITVITLKAEERKNEQIYIE